MQTKAFLKNSSSVWAEDGALVPCPRGILNINSSKLVYAVLERTQSSKNTVTVFLTPGSPPWTVRGGDWIDGISWDVVTTSQKPGEVGSLRCMQWLWFWQFLENGRKPPLFIHAFMWCSSGNILKGLSLPFVKWMASISCFLCPFVLQHSVSLCFSCISQADQFAFGRSVPAWGMRVRKGQRWKGNTCQIPTVHRASHRCPIFFLTRALWNRYYGHFFLQIEMHKFGNSMWFMQRHILKKCRAEFLDLAHFNSNFGSIYTIIKALYTPAAENMESTLFFWREHRV